MTFYIPAFFVNDDRRPSWTGNYTYSTVTIRGIFDSEEKTIEAINNWVHEKDCTILERWFDDDDIPKNVNSLAFDIALLGNYFDMWIDEDGYYSLNEVISEEYSAIYDKNGVLGVIDY